jgi:predicted porin
MKVKVLSLLVPALLVAGAANAAEIYNKDGNKLDLYGKVDGLHYFSDDKVLTATRPTCVSASKAKLRLTTS